jgi:hypothetical protein
MLIDICTELNVHTLTEAMTLGRPKHMFMSIERLGPCPEIYQARRVKHAVHFDIHPGKPVNVAYHTSHIVSDTGRMTLADGYQQGYRQAMIGLHGGKWLGSIGPSSAGTFTDRRSLTHICPPRLLG